MNKKQRKLKEHQDRLSQFDQEYDHYEEKDMGSEWWVKMWNGGTKRWQVAIFSPQSFQKYKGFQNGETYDEFDKEGFENSMSKD